MADSDLIETLRAFKHRGIWPPSALVGDLIRRGWMVLNPTLRLTRAAEELLRAPKRPPKPPPPPPRTSKWEPCSCCPPPVPRPAERMTARKYSNSLLIGCRRRRRR